MLELLCSAFGFADYNHTLSQLRLVIMPTHKIVDGSADPEKGHDYGSDTQAGVYEEPFVHGHATIGEATGRGGDTHRGLKSRHIQFLYVA